MEHGKRDLLRELLGCRLELTALREQLDPPQRAAWLAERLLDYVSRVEGALGIPGWTMAELADSDTTDLVEIGAELLEIELRGGHFPAGILSRWVAFREGWEKLHAGSGGREDAGRLRELADEIHASVLDLSRAEG